jgi:hypothetical protein
MRGAGAIRTRVALARLVIIFIAVTSTFAVGAQLPVDIGTVDVSSPGHRFYPPSPVGGAYVRDFFIDQSQTSGGGAIVGSFVANFDTNRQFSITVSAPKNYRFVVRVPVGGRVRFGGNLAWTYLDGYYGYRLGPVHADFKVLDGTPPQFGNLSSSISGSHETIRMQPGSSYFSNDLAFTSITLTGTVPPEDPHVGTRTYSPSQIHPCYFYTEYSLGIDDTNDPGRILFLEQEPMAMKTETFDTNPNWDGRNNRATDPGPRQIVQNFGFSFTTNAGGPVGEIGGFITPAGEPAYYAKAITPASFNDPLSVSGIVNVPQGGGHTLIGFFNTNTVNEWRTPNTIAIRIYGRGTYFLGYLDYGTALWRAGGGSFGGEAPIPTGANDYPFSLNYDPNGGGGRGTVTAMLGNYISVMTLDSGHKADGATFNAFGILNVMKSADDPGTIWLDNVTINGEAHPFDSDPGWGQRNNRRTYTSTNVRPRFNFGYSLGTTFAGGLKGEIGGDTFRGDSRVEFNGTRMAYYGARLTDTLSLNHALHAEGKVGFRRGVSDSTTLIGFFHSTNSMRSNDSQNSATPENFVGAAIEGPSSEGFYLYPAYGLDQEGVRANGGRGSPTPPYIYPDGQSRHWTLDYNPDGNGGTGSITVTLNGQAVTLNLDPGHKQIGAQFNRFGIITTHIDGSGQTVYFDDLTYTLGFMPPALSITRTAPAQAVLQWPTNYTGFTVQSAPGLGSPSLWQQFTNPVTVNGPLYNVSVSTTNAGRFFRLRRP